MVGATIATGAALAAYLLYVRPRHIRWGATDEEVERPMPGDEVVERPTFVATRAVAIEATSEEVWPWLVQTGSGRAGFYSYDWIDNACKPSAREIIPEYQHVEVGDLVPMLPSTEVGMWGQGLRCQQVDVVVGQERRGYLGMGPLSARREAHAPHLQAAHALRLDLSDDYLVFDPRRGRHRDDEKVHDRHKGVCRKRGGHANGKPSTGKERVGG